ATTQSCALPLHDALPISEAGDAGGQPAVHGPVPQHVTSAPHERTIRSCCPRHRDTRKEILMRTAILLATPLLLLAGCKIDAGTRSEEHTSALQSRENVVC